MDGKLEIKICTGTLCYVMGGAELQLIEEHIPEELAARVDISGSQCLDICEQRSGGAPYARVGGRVIEQATINKIITAVREQLDEKL